MQPSVTYTYSKQGENIPRVYVTFEHKILGQGKYLIYAQIEH